MIAYKLLKKRKNGTLGSLFINCKDVVNIGEWKDAEPHKKKGFAFRPGWHCTFKPFAPHLTSDIEKSNRVWCEVEIEDYKTFIRPENQGGAWVLANKMKINKELSHSEVRKILGE